MRFIPLNDNIIVTLDKPPSVSEGGIHLPPGAVEVAENSVETGVISAIGPGWTGRDGVVHVPTVKVGQRVACNRYSGSTVTLGGEEVVVIDEGGILCVIEE